MVTINNKEYRNLVEQVLKNKEDIAKHYDADRVLEDYGIKVVGQVDFVDQLPSAALYTGAYGDAYLVGVSAPYDFYIFTRPFAGETENQWLDLGQLAIQGPEGAQGPEGPQGPRGKNTRWYIGQTDPYGEGYSDGDCYLNSKTGVVFIFENNVWTSQGSIKGETGAQGPKGDKGDKGDKGEQGLQGEAGVPGDAVRIVGLLTSPSMLPDPNTVDRDTAYVVSDTVGNLLFFITGLGTEDSPLIWRKVPFENGTTVLVDGNPVEVFDANTKYDKLPVNNSYDIFPFIVHGTDKLTYKTYASTVAAATNSRIPGYTPAGRNVEGAMPTGILVSGTPQYGCDCANKKYVDDTIATAGATKMNTVKNTSNSFIVPVIPFGSDQPTTRILASNTTDVYSGRIPYYLNDSVNHTVPANGWLITATPKSEGDCANKKYVDDRVKFKTEGMVQQLSAGSSMSVQIPLEYGTTPYLLVEINVFGGTKSTAGVSFSEGAAIYNYIKLLYTPTTIILTAQNINGDTYVAGSNTPPTLYAKGTVYITQTYTKLNLPA